MKKILYILLLSITPLISANNLHLNEAPNVFQEKNIDKLSAYPNPLTAKTTITFFSDSTQFAVFTVKNLLGKTVYINRVLANPGKNDFIFFKEKLDAGMYIYSIQTDSGIISKRLIIK
ncbi:T9SS type A sorting domain-containing protein [Urechidicola vernalis]|uniref:T9SS type A sorting domain-containing protein n=1 Tax=Urechidicola vernalis TaxID=3075600 RepID=A0ABU2Y324_9FLAO|nr:T9SS type A sorting domain-containing protein [Urechidicola sp. P050]MDT0552432.1 T9SS type A sorting domain-containing protein [Urechidicola sp. P050]